MVGVGRAVFWNKTRVPKASLPNDHIVWIHGGKAVDLGPATLEDLKLMAYVSQQAYIRLPTKKNAISPNTLSRARALSRRMYDAARLTETG